MQPDFSTKHTARVKAPKYIAQHLCEQDRDGAGSENLGWRTPEVKPQAP